VWTPSELRALRIARGHYHRPFSSAITLPQLVSESRVIALLLATFSMQSGQANSSSSGANRSMAGEMIFPISRPHFLHFILSGKDIMHLFNSLRGLHHQFSSNATVPKPPSAQILTIARFPFGIAASSLTA